MFTKLHWRNDVAEKGRIEVWEYIQFDIGAEFKEIKRLLNSEITKFKKRMMKNRKL